MTKVETILILLSQFLMFGAFVSHLIGILFREKGKKIGNFLYLGGLIFLTAGITARWVATSHPPVMDRYENAILASFFLGVLYFLGLKILREVENLGTGVSFISLFLVGWGLVSKPVLLPLSPQYKSYWLWIHVGFAWLAFGSFAISAIGGLYQLLKNIRRIEIEEFIFSMIIAGFIAQGAMIISGAIWASNLWGSYWNWDPVETWSLICWLIYGVIIHFRLIFGWKGKFIAIAAVIGFISMIITFFGIHYITRFHTILL
jgi:ABC-type transport system involved in cytochrome c biogenesis permease subunit